MTLDDLLAKLKNYKAAPGETGVQRISWAYGQTLLAQPPDADKEEFRQLAEQAVCANYEEEIEKLREKVKAMQTIIEARSSMASALKASWLMLNSTQRHKIESVLMAIIFDMAPAQQSVTMKIITSLQEMLKGET